MIEPAVPTTVIKTVFNIYLDSGTNESENNEGRMVKLSSVGLRTKNLGGKTNNSSRGLNAFETENITGISIIIPNNARKRKFIKSPQNERPVLLLKIRILMANTSFLLSVELCLNFLPILNSRFTDLHF